MKCIQIYKFRAECIVDVHRFLYSLAPNWVEYHVTATTFPDVTVALKTAATLDELCSVIKTVPDGHVMLETIQPLDRYTGERVERD